MSLIKVIISVLRDGSNLGAEARLSNKSEKKPTAVNGRGDLLSPDSSVPPGRLNGILTEVSFPPRNYEPELFETCT